MLCFRTFLVEKTFMDKREGDVSEIHSKFFCLTVPKKFAGEAFCNVFQKISGKEKDYG